MADYCLIGEKLGHSFSKIIHEKMGYEYDLVEVEKDNVIISNNGEYYSLPIYTLSDLLKQAEIYLK